MAFHAVAGIHAEQLPQSGGRGRPCCNRRRSGHCARKAHGIRGLDKRRLVMVSMPTFPQILDDI
jgi:hypothetical protein